MIALNHRPTTVIGVVPKRLARDPDGMVLFHPASPTRAQAPGHSPYHLYGRLKPGVSFEQAAADIAFLAKRFAPLYASDHPKGVAFTVESYTTPFAAPSVARGRSSWEL